MQDPEVLWLGWAAEEIPPGEFEDEELTWQLTGVDGPGSFHIFTNDPFGDPKVMFDSDDGSPDTTTIPTGAHVHGNWTFSAAGEYEVTFEISGTPVGGEPLTSGPVVYRFVVGAYECGDVDDLVLSPASVAGGSTVDVSYALSNCGTTTSDIGVTVQVRAPQACGGGVDEVTVGPRTLDAAESVADTVVVTAPSCAGTYSVKAKPTGVPEPYRYASLQNLTVTG